MPNKKLTQEIVEEFLRLNSNEYLYHRENSELEFKEQFNFNGLAEYLRDFAAFANNIGGYIIFGVSESPRRLNGLSESALSAFSSIDPETITGHILENFSANIYWNYNIFQINGRYFGVFSVDEAINKPIIAKKDAGRDQVIKNADIYYRYGGRTQRIQHAELENIIQKRIDAKSFEWKNLISSLAKINPSDAHILALDSSNIGKDNNILYMDKDLAKQINFIKEGEFTEKKGAKALKMIGEVQVLGAETVERITTESLIEAYPLSYQQLVEEITGQIPSVRRSKINEVIKENDMKNNTDYSAYNFRNKKQADNYEQNNILPKGITSIYNHSAVEYIVSTILFEDL